MTFDLRKAYAEQLKQDYLKTGFTQGFEAGHAKAKEDFERLHGEWVEGFDGHFETLNCNKCGYSKPSTHYEFNFCPNCGVPMTEKALEIIRKREGDKK